MDFLTIYVICYYFTVVNWSVLFNLDKQRLVRMVIIYALVTGFLFHLFEKNILKNWLAFVINLRKYYKIPVNLLEQFPHFISI